MNRTPSDEGGVGFLRVVLLFLCSVCVAMGLSTASPVVAQSESARSPQWQPAHSQAVVAQPAQSESPQSQSAQGHSAQSQLAQSQTLVAQAQSGPSSPQSPSAPGSLLGSSVPDLQHRAVDIESSQPDPHEQYLLGGGDEINVTVAGRPELSGVQVVGPDGRITLPLVGSVDVGEKSRDEAAMAIDDALSKYYSGKVASTVQVTHYGSNHILLLGAVEHTGLIEFDQPPSLLEALTKGGSSTSGKSVGTPKRCIVYRGSNQVMNVNISERLDGQKALNDIRLRRNDIVYVPANQQSTISVLGEVSHPGAVDLSPEMTLVSVIATSGGLTQQASSNPEILIVEPSTGRRQQVKFKDLLKVPGGGSDITLHDGDIVYVPRSGLASFGFFMQQISPVTQVGSIAILATR